MNTDDFEKRLQRQPPRKIPPDWRAGILSAARRGAQTLHVSPFTHSSRRSQTKADHAPHNAFHVSRFTHHASRITHQLSTLLWPHPKAWAGLAAIWLGLLVVNFGTAGKRPAVAERTAQTFMALQEQEQLLAELIGPPEVPAGVPPKPAAPRPRSEWGVRRNASLPHKCGVPRSSGTLHLCGRTWFRPDEHRNEWLIG